MPGAIRRVEEMTGHAKKATDSQIISAYKKTGNVWDAGKSLGMAGQSVYERLIKLKVELNRKDFNEDDTKRIEREYLIYRNSGKLGLLAKKMNKSKHLICRKARELNLTDQKHKKIYFGKWKYMNEDTARILFDKFRDSKYTMNIFCKKNSLDDGGFSKTMSKFFPDEWEHTIESKIPRQTMYRVGRSFEYRVRDAFRKIGYFVLRSPRSGSPVDLIAVKKGSLLFIQCKKGSILPRTEWNDLYKLSLSVDSIPILASSPFGQGIVYEKILDFKIEGKHKQPKEIYTPRSQDRAQGTK